MRIIVEMLINDFRRNPRNRKLLTNEKRRQLLLERVEKFHFSVLVDIFKVAISFRYPSFLHVLPNPNNCCRFDEPPNVRTSMFVRYLSHVFVFENSYPTFSFSENVIEEIECYALTSAFPSVCA